MDQQLTLDLEAEQPSAQRLVVLKNDVEILSIDAGSLPHAQVMRRSLVEMLQRDPRHRTVWEENPRPTGWWGLLSGQPNGAVVYNIIIEPRTETDPHECIT